MNKTEKKLIYAVILFRKDGSTIVLEESPNYDSCFSCWQKHHELWEVSAKETKPFVITSPVVTAFEPGMISEIKLIPVNSEELSEKAQNNPYFKRMASTGLGSMLQGNIGYGSDILDGGRI